MYTCECGKQFEKQGSLNSHARFCNLYVKKEKLVSKYKLNETLYECECKKQFENAQSLNAHFSHCLVHRNGKAETRPWLNDGKMCGWNFSEKEISEFKKRSGKTLSNNIKLGIIKPSFLGKHHTKKTKEKLSISNNGRNNGYVKTKYFEIFCPFENKNVKVQGTWEFKYATFLNENKINWIRSKTINLKYKLFETDYWHTYYPDFYLPDVNEYIEIKGYWWKSNDGRIDDKRKMQMVEKYNQDKKITVITNLQ